MRMKGCIKIACLILADFVFMYYLLGVEISLIFTGLIIVYAFWLGEYIALFQDRAVSLDRLSECERNRLYNSLCELKNEILKSTHVNLKYVKLYVVPTKEVNAFAYGFRNISVTEGTLKAADGMMLNAVLAHELAHVINLDAITNRIIFANVTGMIFIIALSSFVTSSALWILFLLLSFFGVCGSFVSVFFVSAVVKRIKIIHRFIQKMILSVYRIFIGFISRRDEYRADEYASKLGYGMELKYFIQCFLAGREFYPQTLRDILYDTHPSPEKRIRRLEHLAADIVVEKEKT